MTSRDDSKVDHVTDRLFCLGIEAALDNIEWWGRRLIAYESQNVEQYLIDGARKQIAVQKEWLAEHGVKVG